MAVVHLTEHFDELLWRLIWEPFPGDFASPTDGPTRFHNDAVHPFRCVANALDYWSCDDVLALLESLPLLDSLNPVAGL